MKTEQALNIAIVKVIHIKKQDKSSLFQRIKFFFKMTSNFMLHKNENSYNFK